MNTDRAHIDRIRLRLNDNVWLSIIQGEMVYGRISEGNVEVALIDNDGEFIEEDVRPWMNAEDLFMLLAEYVEPRY